MRTTQLGTRVPSTSRRPLKIAAAVAAALLVATACQSDDSTPAGDDTGGDSEGGGDLVVATGTLGPMEWKPSLACADNEKMMLHVQDSLTQLDPETRQVGPMLAESFELSDDSLTWTFTLRPDVPFHDDWGTVTAEDVKFTYEQWIAEDSCHNSRHQLIQAIDGDIANFEIVDELTFRLHATTPVTDLPGVVCACDTGLQITSKRYYEETGEEANEHPIGTGPFTFVSSQPGVEIVLEKFDDYWNGPPNHDRLILREIPDGAARLAQVQSGEVDIAELPSALKGEAEAASLQVLAVPDIGNAYVVLGGIFTGHPNLDTGSPWIQADDPEAGLAVREAMSLAIDRELILDTILDGEGELTHGVALQYPANPGLVDPSWDLPAHDLDLAKEKLAEGGYPDGFPVEILLFQQDVDTVAVGEAIAGMWEELGLEVTRTPVEEDAVQEAMANQATAGQSFVLIQSFKPEPGMVLGNLVSTRLDDSRFFHPAIDEGFLEVVSEPDPAERLAIARRVLDALRNDMTALPMFTINMLFVMGADVSSWEPVPGVNTYTNLNTVS